MVQKYTSKFINKTNIKNKMEVCAYYEQKTKSILEILPTSTSPTLQKAINDAWSQPIAQKILIYLSENGKATGSEITSNIPHSPSTIHDTLKKLEQAKIINSKIEYDKSKHRIITSNTLFVTKNPKYKTELQKFFKGLWTNSKKTSLIIDFLKTYKDKKFTAEELSIKLNIPVDEVELLLSNWDSQTTRGLSEFMKEKPFTKTVYYQGK